MKELITSFVIVVICLNLSASVPQSTISDLYNLKEVNERPLTVTQYSEENLIELSVTGSEIKNILILNAKGAIVGNIENITPRMALNTSSWPQGNYTLLYTVENTSFKEEVYIR